MLWKVSRRRRVCFSASSRAEIGSVTVVVESDRATGWMTSLDQSAHLFTSLHVRLHGVLIRRVQRVVLIACIPRLPE
jgi:hypothetical protein